MQTILLIATIGSVLCIAMMMMAVIARVEDIEPVIRDLDRDLTDAEDNIVVLRSQMAVLNAAAQQKPPLGDMEVRSE